MILFSPYCQILFDILVRKYLNQQVIIRFLQSPLQIRAIPLVPLIKLSHRFWSSQLSLFPEFFRTTVLNKVYLAQEHQNNGIKKLPPSFLPNENENNSGCNRPIWLSQMVHPIQTLWG